MKSVRIAILGAIAAAGMSAGPALAQTCDTTYTGPDQGAWQNSNNWDEDEPDATKVACVPSNYEVWIYPGSCDAGSTNAGDGCDNDSQCDGGDCELDPDVAAKAIVADGTLWVRPYTTLTISDASTVDGDMIVGPGAKLIIDEDLTITGDGGDILGKFMFCAVPTSTLDYIKKCVGGGSAGQECDEPNDCPTGTMLTGASP